MKPFSPLLILLFIFLYNGDISAQTNIGGAFYSDTTLTKANSPYLVTSDITIFQGNTLTIEPGVEIIFDGLTKIILRGSMYAVGTLNDSIRFTGKNKGKHRGIEVWSNDSVRDYQMKMQYCVVEDAANVVYFQLYMPRGRFDFKHCSFRNNVDVFMDHPGYVDTTVFDSCSFIGNNDCIDGGGWSSNAVIISNSFFKDNKIGTTGGIINNCVFMNHREYAVTNQVLLKDCILYNNKIGLVGRQYDGATAVNNQIIYNEVGVNIMTWQNGAPKNLKLKGNIICHNTRWNIEYKFNNNITLDTNCFCISDSTKIRATISDGYVNPSYGLITFSYRDSCSVTMGPPPPTSVSSEISEAIGIDLYPNPTTGKVTVNWDSHNLESYKVYVTDISGKMMMPVISVTGGKSQIDLSGFNSGIYILRLIDGKGFVKTKKVAVQ